jgi:hypothetical protein
MGGTGSVIRNDAAMIFLNTTPSITAPLIAADHAALAVYEGSPTSNSGTFSDPQGNSTVTLTASLGTVTKNDAAGTWSWSYTPSENTSGPIPVAIIATAGGETTTATFNLTVANAAPTITAFNVPANAKKGAPVTLSAAATDPAGANDPLSYNWTITRTDGTTFALTGASASFTPLNTGSYRAFLTVSDGDGGVAVAPGNTDGVVSWYRAEGDASDVTGAYAGTLNGGVSFAPGRAGQAFSFDGIDDTVALPPNFLPVPTTGTSTAPLAFETWFRTSAANGVILGQSGPGGFVPAVYVGTDGKLRAQMFWGGSANPFVSAAPVNDGQFHHVAVTYDGSSETAYLDGVSIGSRAFTQTAYSNSYSYSLGSGAVAGWPSAGSAFFNGQIDEPAFFSRALSSSDVQAMFAGGIPSGAATITVLDESGSFLPDAPKPSVAITWSADVQASSIAAGDLTLTNLTTGESINTATASTVTYNAATRTATWQFPELLPDGNYRATLAPGRVNDLAGNPLAADCSFAFFVLAGDANRDRTVDTLDFNALAANFGGSNKTFSQGDFNYDGVVDTLDFNSLAANFGKSLAAPTVPAAPAQRSSLFSQREIVESNDLI